MVEHLTFNQVVGGSIPPCLITNSSADLSIAAVFCYLRECRSFQHCFGLYRFHFFSSADMAKLADAPDLGSGGTPRAGSSPVIRTFLTGGSDPAGLFSCFLGNYSNISCGFSAEPFFTVSSSIVIISRHFTFCRGHLPSFPSLYCPRERLFLRYPSPDVPIF